MKVIETMQDGTFRFVCPSCGGHRLEEVLDNALVETPVTFQIEPSRRTGMRMIYGVARCVEGEIIKYQCSCGFAPSNKDGEYICDDSALEEWLNNPVGLEKIIKENESRDQQIPLG
jgi:predicted RNA-binding Zn-ribbon protein involved in translation (DUF1610 family)